MLKSKVLTTLFVTTILAISLGAWIVSPAGAQIPAPTSPALSEAEQAALNYMREEEKLAHDVYQLLYETWGLPIFQNIAKSEQTHTDAIRNLLNRYGLPDPASSQAGVFTNPELQKLYDDLSARGKTSLSEALLVGGAIEEIDILDLQERLAMTSRIDIQLVLNNLLRGSTNHLKAFASTLERQTGTVYQPQYLSLAAYQELITSGMPGRYGSGVGSAGAGAGGFGRGRRP